MRKEFYDPNEAEKLKREVGDKGTPERKRTFEEQPEELTSEEKFELAKERHPNPRSLTEGLLKEMPGRLRNKIDHKLGDSNQKWLEDRAKLMAERSGANELLENFDSKEIWVGDFGGGKEQILREFIKNSDKDIKTANIDISDYASKKVFESEEGEKMNSVFGRVENAPIGNEKIKVATAYFTFQELNDDQQKEVLEEMKRVIKDDGRIIIVDEPPQEKKDGIVARGKNILRNLKVSPFNLKSDEEWRKLFEDHGLEIDKFIDENGEEIEKYKIFGDDKENKKKQFISYILRKIEKKEEKVKE